MAGIGRYWKGIIAAAGACGITLADPPAGLADLTIEQVIAWVTTILVYQIANSPISPSNR